MLLPAHLGDSAVLPVWAFRIQTVPSLLLFWLFLKFNEVRSEQKSEPTGYVRVWMLVLLNAVCCHCVQRGAVVTQSPPPLWAGGPGGCAERAVVSSWRRGCHLVSGCGFPSSGERARW